ncbi:ATP-binding response regulator [Aestuariirhabdus litorea]|uniref:histidine kinase n=1 Tax=Aestuariirhabdus litorea TaxID=2528527 RepID=A0A3P3VNY2_9GAMM|nr:response regulator [Aestuariirhabdus litorea]RRJ83628.1 hybrid sensor histidine kinase/response regulator [Aestuariirhabdus litorea]RWW96849.1 response regulator [Endozoicomonadaceae bacterium GTF-13]
MDSETPVGDVADSCILLVDDNPTNLQVLLQTLNGRGYRLLVAKTGESALRIARKAMPAVVLLDIMMPGIDGYEVCRQLKADPLTERITIIFLSALDDTKDKVKGLELGAVDFITKPFQSDEVIARVETQLKIHQLEAALSARNRQLEAENERILEAMSEGILGIDIEGKITFANRAACDISGWSESQLIGSEFHRRLLGQPAEALASPSPLQITLREGSSQRLEDVTCLHQDGTPFAANLSCNPIMESGQCRGAVVLFRDITEQKQQQQALQQALDEIQSQKENLTHVSRLSTMGEMAAGFAHEVNQPLTAISNYSQVCTRFLQRDPLDRESLTEALEKIGTQARRAGEIIARIRSFVKKPRHVLEEVSCNKLIQDVVRLAEVDARNNCMEIHTRLADNLPLLRVDPVQIQQVALNLIRNGMEAMRDCERRDLGILVETEFLPDTHQVQVSVIDRGTGLPADAEEKLFTPFYTTKESGMGIGLSICETIINSHEGRLYFERHPEGGTIFRFTLPTV